VYCRAQAVSGQFLCYSTAIIYLHTAALPGSLCTIYEGAQHPKNTPRGFRWAQRSNWDWVWDALANRFQGPLERYVMETFIPTSPTGCSQAHAQERLGVTHSPVPLCHGACPERAPGSRATRPTTERGTPSVCRRVPSAGAAPGHAFCQVNVCG